MLWIALAVVIVAAIGDPIGSGHFGLANCVTKPVTVDDLRVAIARAGAPPAPAAYAMARRNRFLGRWLAHGEGYPDWNVRLFDRRRALTLLFDFEWINANLYSGAYKRSEGFFDDSELSSIGRPASERELALLKPYPGAVRDDVIMRS